MNQLNNALNCFINTGADDLLKSYHMEQVTVHGKYGDYQAMRRKANPESKASSQHVRTPVKDTSISHTINRDFTYLSSDYKPYSLEQVCDRYNKGDNRKKYKTLNEFISRNYRVSAGRETTADWFRHPGGQYDKKRFDEVHRPILKKLLDSADTPKDRKPICFLFGGGSASGKSSVANYIVEPTIKDLGLKFARLDCDSIKEQLPEHEAFIKQNPETAAYREHMESSDLSNTAIKELIKAKKCFCFDGTMADVDKYSSIISQLKDNGYEVHIVATDIPVDLAIERANKRSRKISEKVIRRTHQGFAESFFDIASMDVDSFQLWDNSQEDGQKPTLIASSDEGVQNEDMWDRFMAKGGM